jgi:hypothetical protein
LDLEILTTGQIIKKFLVDLLGPKSNAELVLKFHVALLASHVAFSMLTLKFRPNAALQILIKIHRTSAFPTIILNHFHKQ